MSAKSKVPALVVGSTGMLLLYSGIRGKSVLTVGRGLLHGQSPTSSPASNAVTTPPVTSQFASTGPGTNLPAGPDNSNMMVSAALRGVGHCYLYGGAPGTDGKSCWDCSSFMNYTIAVLLGMQIPGGFYDGSVHGPATGSWMTTTLCKTVSEANTLPGDLVVGPTHMGMVTGPGEYVSAHDPAEGTSISSLDFFPDPIKMFRRLVATTGTLTY